MKKKIEIMSRKAAESAIQEGFPENAAVISFYDSPTKRMPTDYKPVNYRGVCDRVFYVRIHDIDPEVLADHGLTFKTYFPEADALAAFVQQVIKDGCAIVCQCEYGQSRSAACAAAIREFYDREGIKVFADYRYYSNQLIFNKLLFALRKAEKDKHE